MTKRTLRDFLGTHSLALPVLSALLLILALPPINLWWLVSVALIPLYIFLLCSSQTLKIILGGTVFGLLFSGYITVVIFSGFTWIPETFLFVWFMKGLGVFTIGVVTLITILGLLTTSVFDCTFKVIPYPRVLFFGIFALVDWTLGFILFGFNYGSLAYTATHLEVIRILSSVGGTFLVTLVIVLFNASLAEVLIGVYRRHNILYRSIPLISVLSIVFIIQIYQTSIPTSNLSRTLSVALIQDQEREEELVFGSVSEGEFIFPALESYIEQAATFSPDVIVYPLAPWSGVLSDSIDNTYFDREVITMSDTLFSNWLQKYVPTDVMFVTWYTTYRSGQYFNEIVFWKNGKLLGSYQKRKLFPFFDYTPQWAQEVGLYSLPYDGTQGESRSAISTKGINMGGLVCSEVSDQQIAKENSAVSDILFAIGSEAMFSHEIPSEYNYLNAQLRATELAIPVVRANKFGPSAVFDATGKEIAYMPYGKNGVLFAEISIPSEQKITPYERFGENTAVLIFGIVLLIVSLRKNIYQWCCTKKY